MRDFTKVSPRIFASKRFQGLTNSDVKLLYLYVLFGPHQTSLGISKLPMAYAAHDLQWPKESVEPYLEACIHAGLLEHDPNTDEIRVVGWFFHNPPMNQSHLKGVMCGLERVESLDLAESADQEISQVYHNRDAPSANKPPKIDAETGEIVPLET